jgi:hypothetical protein
MLNMAIPRGRLILAINPRYQKEKPAFIQMSGFSKYSSG